MGYQTEFIGRFDLDKELDREQISQLKEFNETRHGGNLEPFPGMPDFWCQWVPTEDAKGIEWDGGEKFYHYVEWIEYLIEHFIKPWGLQLGGSVNWEGEDSDDLGLITVKDNVVTTHEGIVVYPDQEQDDLTRLFFVVDSQQSNEELYETLEGAEKQYELLDKDGAELPRIRICIVKHAYRNTDEDWNYEDRSDTFEVVKTIKE